MISRRAESRTFSATVADHDEAGGYSHVLLHPYPSSLFRVFPTFRGFDVAHGGW
jgi:hypothetical protein